MLENKLLLIGFGGLFNYELAIAYVGNNESRTGCEEDVGGVCACARVCVCECVRARACVAEVEREEVSECDRVLVCNEKGWWVRVSGSVQ